MKSSSEVDSLHHVGYDSGANNKVYEDLGSSNNPTSTLASTSSSASTNGPSTRQNSDTSPNNLGLDYYQSYHPAYYGQMQSYMSSFPGYSSSIAAAGPATTTSSSETTAVTNSYESRFSAYGSSYGTAAGTAFGAPSVAATGHSAINLSVKTDGSSQGAAISAENHPYGPFSSLPVTSEGTGSSLTGSSLLDLTRSSHGSLLG